MYRVILDKGYAPLLGSAGVLAKSAAPRRFAHAQSPECNRTRVLLVYGGHPTAIPRRQHHY